MIHPDHTPRRTETGQLDTGYYLNRAHEIRSQDAHRWVRKTGQALQRAFRRPA